MSIERFVQDLPLSAIFPAAVAPPVGCVVTSPDDVLAGDVMSEIKWTVTLVSGVRAHARACLCALACVCVRARACACVRGYLLACLHVFMYVYACVFACTWASVPWEHYALNFTAGFDRLVLLFLISVTLRRHPVFPC